MDYKTGIVHLSSSDGTLLEIPESKLSNEDLTYVRSLGVYTKAQHRVIASIHHFLFFTEIAYDNRPAAD